MRHALFFTLMGWWLAGLVALRAEEPLQDRGKDVIGTVSVMVYHSTDGDPGAVGKHSQEVGKDLAERLRRDPHLKFKHYRMLGGDKKPLFRSYENWAQPFGGSDQLMVRFESQSKMTKEGTRLDLELWLARKKILKTDVAITPSRPVYVLGPVWRGGRLIISVGLAPGANPGS